MIPGEQHNGAGHDWHEQHRGHRHGPVEGDGGGTQEAQVQGGALEGQAGAAQLEEAVVPGYVAHQLQQWQQTVLVHEVVGAVGGV